MTLSQLSERLGRPALWISRMRKQFGLPVLEQYPKSYEIFLRKIRDLKNLGVSEEKLRDLWHLEVKLIEILHLDLGQGELSVIEGCTAESDPSHRLLLSNADLGVPLMARDIQAGLDFKSRPRELFEGKEMGEDALRILREYSALIHEIKQTVARERRVLKEGLKWQKTVSLGA